MPAIGIGGLTFSYRRGVPALNGVSFEIGEGDLCGLVGASGSGKSTLLKVIAGILPSDGQQRIEGEVAVLGQAASTARRSTRVAYVFQDYRLLPFLTVKQNLEWARSHAHAAGKSEKPDRSTGELLALVGLEGQANAYPRMLSGGMQARAAIARALTGRPRLLLIDEAFSALDVGWRLHLYRELKVLQRLFELTVIAISHDIDDICTIATRVLALSPQGTIAGMVAIPQGSSDLRTAADSIRKLVLKDHPATRRLVHEV